MPILGTIASGISGHLTSPWSPEGAYDSLATISLSTAAASVTFSGIPTGYKHLQIRATMMCSAVNNMYLQLGSGAIDTGANYSWHQLYGDGSSALSNGTGSATFSYIGYNNSISYPNPSIVDIMDYANLSKFKTYKTLAGTEANGTGFVQLWGGNWRSTSAITSIKITPGSGNFTQHSTFALYGVK